MKYEGLTGHPPPHHGGLDLPLVMGGWRRLCRLHTAHLAAGERLGSQSM
jgi:hypothetical protein